MRKQFRVLPRLPQRNGNNPRLGGIGKVNGLLRFEEALLGNRQGYAELLEQVDTQPVVGLKHPLQVCREASELTAGIEGLRLDRCAADRVTPQRRHFAAHPPLVLQALVGIVEAIHGGNGPAIVLGPRRRWKEKTHRRQKYEHA